MSKNISFYENDFYAWTQNTAELLRQGRLQEIDIEHIAEELESMGKRDKREIISRLSILLMHLLKWQFQPGFRGASWQNTIIEQRQQVQLILEDSPSLKHQVEEKITKAYQSALRKAVNETGLPLSHFPQICPYTLEQMLDDNFYPIDTNT
jgi:hypothetical protein